MTVIYGPERFSLKVGTAIRRSVRRALLESGVEFTEERGWLDSVFFVSVASDEVLTLTLPGVQA